MFWIFLACLTYFWLWLETARLPVYAIQSCDMAMIWVMELVFVCNWGRSLSLCVCVLVYEVVSFKWLYITLTCTGLVHFDAVQFRCDACFGTVKHHRYQWG